MVDAEPVDSALLEQPQHEGMGVVKQFGQFHPQPGKVVDVEEAAIIDVVAGDAEMRGAPMLIPDQGVEHRRVAIQLAHRCVDGLLHRGVIAGKPAEFRFQLAGAADDLRMPIRQAGKSIADAFQFGVGIAEDARVVQRADRQLVLVVRPYCKIAVGAVEF